jgi:hypothetical protein
MNSVLYLSILLDWNSIIRSHSDDGDREINWKRLRNCKKSMEQRMF